MGFGTRLRISSSAKNKAELHVHVCTYDTTATTKNASSYPLVAQLVEYWHKLQCRCIAMMHVYSLR